MCTYIFISKFTVVPIHIYIRYTDLLLIDTKYTDLLLIDTKFYVLVKS